MLTPVSNEPEPTDKPFQNASELKTIPEISRLLQYSPRQIREYLDQGAPIAEVAERPNPHKINVADFHHWLVQRARADRRGNASAEDPKNRERAAKAELAEIDLLIKRGELYNLSDVTRKTDDNFVELKAELARAFKERWNGSRRHGEELILEICNQYRERLQAELADLEPATG